MEQITENSEVFEESIVEAENDTTDKLAEDEGTNEGEETIDKTTQRLTQLPISRIKNIMKFDDEVHLATQEAVFLIAKATELFIESFSKEAVHFTVANKKKTIQKKDVDSAVWSQDCFLFLDGCLNE